MREEIWEQVLGLEEPHIISTTFVNALTFVSIIKRKMARMVSKVIDIFKILTDKFVNASIFCSSSGHVCNFKTALPGMSDGKASYQKSIIMLWKD